MGISDLDLVANGVRQYVVTPLNAFGLGGFVFDIEGDTTANLTAEITDHFLEDNATVQDHIAIKPKKFVLKRYVGELVYRQDNSVTTDVQKVVQKLTVLDSFLPTLSRGVQQLANIKSSDLTLNNLRNLTASTTINKVTDYWSFVQNITGIDSAQQRAYMYLKSLYENRALVSLQTPFEFVNNMAIESIVAVQAEGQKYVSDFTITLKQMRFASLITSPTNSTYRLTAGNDNNAAGSATNTGTNVQNNSMQDKASIQNEPLRNNGNVPGTSNVLPTNDAGWRNLGTVVPPRDKLLPNPGV